MGTDPEPRSRRIEPHGERMGTEWGLRPLRIEQTTEDVAAIHRFGREQASEGDDRLATRPPTRTPSGDPRQGRRHDQGRAGRANRAPNPGTSRGGALGATGGRRSARTASERDRALARTAEVREGALCRMAEANFCVDRRACGVVVAKDLPRPFLLNQFDPDRPLDEIGIVKIPYTFQPLHRHLVSVTRQESNLVGKVCVPRNDKLMRNEEVMTQIDLLLVRTGRRQVCPRLIPTGLDHCRCKGLGDVPGFRDMMIQGLGTG
jgi:hypothetical protein